MMTRILQSEMQSTIHLHRLHNNYHLELAKET